MRHPGGHPTPSCGLGAALLLLSVLRLPAGDLDPRLQKLRDQWRKQPAQALSRLETLARPVGSGVAVPVTIALRDLRLLDDLRIPYTRVTPTLVTAEVPLAALDALEQAASVQHVELAHRKRPHKHNDRNMLKLNVAVPYASGYTGTQVLVGIVDSGIDVSHPAFRVGGTASGDSRILRLWDQTAPHVPFSIGAFSSTKGRLWTAAEITAGLCTQVDTDGHGTHVAGSAVGYDAAYPDRHGAAKGANLLFAKTTFNSTDVQNAVVWMHEQAKALGKPLVVNLSLGSQYGPHDATDLDTKALDDLIASSRGQLMVVRSAGNDAGSANHDSGLVTPSGLSLPLTIATYAPSATQDDLIAMNFYIDATAHVSVRIKDSAGTPSPWFAPATSGYSGTLTDGTGYYVKNNAAAEAYNPAIKRIYIDLGEQDGVNDGRHIRSGGHTLEFKTEADSTRLDGWLYYTGPSDHEVPATFTSPEVEMTLSNDACGRNILSVAAHTSRKWWPSAEGPTYSYRGSSLEEQIASFSSVGPTRDQRQKPDITAGGCAVLSAKSSASSVESWQLPAVGGSTYRMMQGTSMSSPTVAGAVALLKERFPAWNHEDVLLYFKSNSQGTAVFTTPGTWNKHWGWGVVDLQNSGQAATISISPSGTVQAQPGATLTFKARVTGLANNTVVWSVSAGGGTLTPTTTAGDGVAVSTFTAPSSPGTCTVTATSQADPAVKASTTVQVKTLDLNGDGAIDTLDVLQLTRRWGSTTASDLATADLNGDGKIDDADLDLLQNAL